MSTGDRFAPQQGPKRGNQVTLDKPRKIRGVRSFPVDKTITCRSRGNGQARRRMSAAIGVVGKKPEGPDPNPHLPDPFLFSQPATTRLPCGESAHGPGTDRRDAPQAFPAPASPPVPQDSDGRRSSVPDCPGPTRGREHATGRYINGGATAIMGIQGPSPPWSPPAAPERTGCPFRRAFSCCIGQIATIASVDTGHRRCARAVRIDRRFGGDDALGLEETQNIEYLLGPVQGEGGDEDVASPLKGLTNRLSEGAVGSCRSRNRTMGRFDDHHIPFIDLSRGREEGGNPLPMSPVATTFTVPFFPPIQSSTIADPRIWPALRRRKASVDERTILLS